MPWVSETQYIYTPSLLKTIADCYETLYTDGIEIVIKIRLHHIWEDADENIRIIRIEEPLSVIEYKADFDMALNDIGQGNWRGLTSFRFSDYKWFGWQQRVVIADVLGVPDNHLEAMGFKRIGQLRGNAYGRMLSFLNEKSIVQNYARS